jgi:hypothetical protein
VEGLNSAPRGPQAAKRATNSGTAPIFALHTNPRKARSQEIANFPLTDIPTGDAIALISGITDREHADEPTGGR